MLEVVLESVGFSEIISGPGRITLWLSVKSFVIYHNAV